MENELPKRKHTRLQDYDYSSIGVYFVTICTKNRAHTLSRIVGRGLAPAEIEYTKFGEIAHEQLLSLEERYSFLTIDKYVIMPNHIHIIFFMKDEAAGANKFRFAQRQVCLWQTLSRPTLMDIVCTYKSLTTRACKKSGMQEGLFQTSFYEHIIRNNHDYEQTVKYVHENPMNWYYDELYSAE